MHAKVEELPEHVDLNPIATAIHQGCMGLPQELVDCIADMLHDDFKALKACSLTCKAMFASTRHLIHRTLYLTFQNNQRILTREEKRRLDTLDSSYDLHLRFLSHMGERGMLQYPRQVHINIHRPLGPEILRPHLHYFQALDQVHTLTINHSDVLACADHHSTWFGHFYPTLTSLALSYPLDNYREILLFALRFPNLENLCIGSYERQFGPGLVFPVQVTDQHPPLSGRLRLVGKETVTRWPKDFFNKLPNRLNFRSLELEDFLELPQHLLDGCAHTVENFTFGSFPSSTRLSSFFPLTTAERLFGSPL